MPSNRGMIASDTDLHYVKPVTLVALVLAFSHYSISALISFYNSQKL